MKAAKRPKKVPEVARRTAKQTRARSTVDVILRATAHVLVRDGYDHASTNRVAERAGVSIGSIYQYFPNKEALLVALVERHVGEMRVVLGKTFMAVSGKTLPEATRAFVLAMIRAHAVDPDLHRVLIEEVPRTGALAKVRAVESDALVLARGYLSGLPGLLPKDVEVAAFLVVTSIEAATHAAVLHRPELLHNETFVDEMVALVERYLVGSPRVRAASSSASPRRSRAEAAAPIVGKSVSGTRKRPAS